MVQHSYRAFNKNNVNYDSFVIKISSNYASDISTGVIQHYVVLENERYRLRPIDIDNTLIGEDISSSHLQLKKILIQNKFAANSNSFDPEINREYLREAWYYVPMFLGIQLSQRGHYKEALKWFKTVYDYTVQESDRIIYSGMEMDNGSTNHEYARNMEDWLLDPLNPHQIALTRANAYLKYTISTIAQTFINY